VKQTIFALCVIALAALPVRAQIPDTYVASGMVANFGAPYNPAPFVAYGTLLTPSDAEMPVFGGFRYELYRDSSGHPAYAGLAQVKVVVWHKGRFFAFGDNSFGGAATVNNVSSALNLGGGAGFILSKSRTPHWEIEIEPRAQRIPALQNGTTGSFLIGMSYTFNRPR
jgi:hypothetical protein